MNAGEERTLINGLFELHHRESEFLIGRIYNFALSSTCKFNEPARNNLCIPLLTFALYSEVTRCVWEESRFEVKSLQSGRRQGW
jgi:hypothetical protein